MEEGAAITTVDLTTSTLRADEKLGAHESPTVRRDDEDGIPVTNPAGPVGER